MQTLAQKNPRRKKTNKKRAPDRYDPTTFTQEEGKEGGEGVGRERAKIKKETT